MRLTLSIICERDYRERRDIPVDNKPRLLDALRETGLTTITIISLASAKWPPQMACIEKSLISTMSSIS